MNCFNQLAKLGLRRRSKDFFIIFYSLVFPTIIIMLLGYLGKKSYGTDFTSYHYYTIVLIPFCSLMALITVAYIAQDEKINKTGYRFLVAPVSKTQIILSKLVSCVIILSLCNVITLIIAKLLFKININGKLIPIILILTTEIIMITGIGLFLGLACKNLNQVRNFLNIPICILGFLGGTFFPFSTTNKILNIIIHLSPLTWIKRGIVSCIYGEGMKTLYITSIVFTFVGLIFCYLTVISFKKEAFLS